jgi:hypothetical protein
MFAVIAFLEIFLCLRFYTRLEYLSKELCHCLLKMFLFSHILMHLYFLFNRKVQMQLVLNLWFWRFAKMHCMICLISQIDLCLEKIILYCTCLWLMQHCSKIFFIGYHLWWNMIRLNSRSYCWVCSWPLLWLLILWTHPNKPLKKSKFLFFRNKLFVLIQILSFIDHPNLWEEKTL